eukprot:1180940-Prorocentrum_minimum.AAC.3
MGGNGRAGGACCPMPRVRLKWLVGSPGEHRGLWVTPRLSAASACGGPSWPTNHRRRESISPEREPMGPVEAQAGLAYDVQQTPMHNFGSRLA